MSILALTSTTQAASPESITPVSILLLGVMLMPGILIAALTGMFRRGSINGPVRLAGDEPVWPMALVTVIGGAVWFMSQIIYGAAASIAFTHGHPNETFNVDKLTGGDFAFLATVPAAVAFAALMLGDVFGGRDLLKRIGFTSTNLPWGIVKGLLAMVIVWPLMALAGVLFELFYRAIRFEHPTTHELLTAMKGAQPWIKYVLIFGACVAAPVFEEFLFRGHLQTLLVRLFNDGRAARKLAAGGLPVAVVPPALAGVSSEHPSVNLTVAALPVPPLPAQVTETIEYARGDFPPPAPPPPQRLVWLAVLITSMIFASVHPLWMAPLIFILSLCLGYAYERTGNLWVSITIHALFNTSSTLLFLK
jgi:membrane protease YdiL (CAAX protease family)